MRQLVPLTTALFLLAVGTALADPGISTFYRDGLLRVTLQGSYSGTYYQVWRSASPAGDYTALASQPTLCTGDCFVHDLAVIPGETYYYRFDLSPPAGGVVSYGPYAVTVPDTRLGVRVWPNPSNGSVRVDMSIPGSSRIGTPVESAARLIDIQGRTVRVLYAGPLARGVTSVTWDGRGDSGRQLGAGIYFLRLSTPLGTSTTRLIRFR